MEGGFYVYTKNYLSPFPLPKISNQDETKPFWLFWFGDDLLDLLKKSKKSDNPYEEISEEDIYYDQENKIWFGKWMDTYFPMKNFICSKVAKSKILKIGSEIDSIEDVTSYKVTKPSISLKQFMT